MSTKDLTRRTFLKGMAAGGAAALATPALLLRGDTAAVEPDPTPLEDLQRVELIEATPSPYGQSFELSHDQLVQDSVADLRRIPAQMARAHREHMERVVMEAIRHG